MKEMKSSELPPFVLQIVADNSSVRRKFPKSRKRNEVELNHTLFLSAPSLVVPVLDDLLTAAKCCLAFDDSEIRMLSLCFSG